LWNALQIDPNIENCLDFWLAILKETNGEEGYKKGLVKASKINTAWIQLGGLKFI